jgi:WD40 repeat protein
MKPLYDDAVSSNKVTCIDISEDGHYLLSGYKKGTVVLWDANKYKLARAMVDVAKSEVTSVKLLYITDQGTINIVVAEDVGRIRFVEVNKGNFFGSFNHNVIPLYEERLIGAATISVCRPSDQPGYVSRFCSQACLVAFGASNQVVLCSMRPIKELISIKPSKYNRKRSIPYIDWGFGLTPTIREQTMPLMAVAWDRMI